MLALSLKDFTINNIFSSLNSVQIVLFFAAMLFVILFGLMLGGIIFYPMGIKNGRKKIVVSPAPLPKSEYYKKEDAKLEEQIEALAEPKTKRSAPVLEFNEDDFNIDDLDFGEELELSGVVAPSGVREENDGYDVTPISLGEQRRKEDEPDIMSVLDDPDFAMLVNKRKREVPVLTRTYLLKYVSALAPLSSTESVSITLRTPDQPFDVATVGEYPFLFVFSIKRVLKLFIRLHQNVYEKLTQTVGDLIKPCADLGEDWYEWILSDGNLGYAPKATLLAYKYVATKEFVKNDDGVIAVGEPYAESAIATMKNYNPLNDEAYVNVIKALNEKYVLDVFAMNEICSYTRSIESETQPSATEFKGNRPGILKAGDHIFGIVFESFGVVKFIFRNSEEFVNDLMSKHNYVKESDYPKSRDWKWYSLLIDDTYSKDEIKSIIDSCYKHVEEYHAEYVITTDE